MTTESTSERPEFPKPLVRLRQVPGGYDAEVRMAADADAVTAAEAEGFVEVPFPEGVLQEYPKWVFHEDGRRKVVSNKAEEDAAEGFGTTPSGEGPDPYEGQVPPAGDAVGATPSTRGPVPVDRG